MPSFFEEVDGVNIHYEKVGTGDQVLLIIPGAIGKSELFSPTLSLISQRLISTRRNLLPIDKVAPEATFRIR